MFDIGWTELLVIGVVALIVIGPQDLPDMFRQIGRFTGKMRAMARDFQKAMDDAAKASGVGDVAKDLRNATSAKGMGLTAVKEAADKFEKWDPLKPAKPAVKAPTPRVVEPPVAAGEATAEELAEAAPAVPKGPSPIPSAAIPKAGPATQAMKDKQAERARIIAETNAKLKALDGSAVQEVAPASAAPVAPVEPMAATAKGDAE
ncbi:MAG: Sec-independent protein translocase protein TatB [Rhodobacterales bacterium]|nr:Sec-independent protein translocase protein TatB [Rhodobacterales bacterium]